MASNNPVRVNGYLTLHQQWLKDRQKLAGTEAQYPHYDEKYDGNPSWYGGLNFDWQIHQDWHLAFQNYFWQAHTPEYGTGFTVGVSTATPVSQTIENKWLGNIALTYQLFSNTQVKLGIKNLSNDTSNERVYADPIERQHLLQLIADW